jgi:hypothetical protein
MVATSTSHLTVLAKRLEAVLEALGVEPVPAGGRLLAPATPAGAPVAQGAGGGHRGPVGSGMFMVSEEAAAAIRTAYEQGGELSASLCASCWHGLAIGVLVLRDISDHGMIYRDGGSYGATLHHSVKHSQVRIG